MTTMRSEPIPRRKLYHEVVDRLRERILSGKYGPGEQLPSERQLMELFQVGRPAIREAMLTLERMGMIAISHGERARVLRPTAQGVIDQVADAARHMLAASPDALAHLTEARLFFEVGMVRIAAANRTEAELDTVKRALDAHREAIEGPARFLEKDMAFHRAIAVVSGNPIYIAISQATFEWLGQYYVELVRLPGAEHLTIAEHTEIYECIAARDVNGAAKAMTGHITRINAQYRTFERAAGAAARSAR